MFSCPLIIWISLLFPQLVSIFLELQSDPTILVEAPPTLKKVEGLLQVPPNAAWYCISLSHNNRMLTYALLWPTRIPISPPGEGLYLYCWLFFPVSLRLSGLPSVCFRQCLPFVRIALNTNFICSPSCLMPLANTIGILSIPSSQSSVEMWRVWTDAISHLDSVW